MSKKKFILGKPRRRSWYQRQSFNLLIRGAGLAVLIVGLALLYNSQVSTHAKDQRSDAGQVITSDGQPSENKPSQNAISSFNVPANQPRSISINSDQIYGLIQKVGITKTGAMATPSNIFYGGWYVNSVKPGQTGLSIINGHVSGKYADGIFKHLTNVKIGDVITVEFGDKSTKKFSVIDRKQLPDSQSTAYLFTKRADVTAQLNLITCGGQFNKASQTFNDRVVVVAKLINS